MSDARDAQRRVAELLTTGLFGDAALREAGEVGEPIAVLDPEGGLSSWLCPVVVGGRLAGFAQLRPDLELLRFSSFADPPEAAAWLDPATVAHRATTAARPDETLDDPVLSYVRDPQRIAWRVVARDSSGRSRTLYVTGDEVFEAAPSDEPSIGS